MKKRRKLISVFMILCITISSIWADFSYAEEGDIVKPTIVYNENEVLPDSNIQKIGTYPQTGGNVYLATLPNGAQPKTITWAINEKSKKGIILRGVCCGEPAYKAVKAADKTIGLTDISTSVFSEENYLIDTQFTEASADYDNLGKVDYYACLNSFQLNDNVVIPTENVKGFMCVSVGTLVSTADLVSYVILQIPSETGTETVNKTTLSAIISDATAIRNSEIYYTEDDRYNGTDTSINGFWTDFQTALDSASGIYENPYAKQEEVDAAASDLTSAAVKLIPKANINATALYEELEISNAKDESDYTEITWSDFEPARTTAQAIFAELFDNEGNPTEYNSATVGTAAADVTAAVENLKTAREGLCRVSESQGFSGTVESTRTKVKTLKEMIDRNPLQEEDYTTESWNAYQEALTAAETVPVLTGTAADETTVNNYKAAYATLYQAYYCGFQPVGEITVTLSWIDRITSKAYKGEVTLQGDCSLNTALTQKELVVSHPGDQENIYINGVSLDSRYSNADNRSADGSPHQSLPDLSDIVLHPGDKVSVLWNASPETLQSPTMFGGKAEFWQYEDSLKEASFSQTDGITVEAGSPFILEVKEAQSAFDAGQILVPADEMSLYASDVTDSAVGICPEQNPVITDGEKVTTDADGKATFALYEEGWHLVAAFDMRNDIMGDLVQYPKDAVQTKGTYYSVNSGALVWVHVTEASDPAAVKADLKAKLDEVYEAYPESIFRARDWTTLKTEYDTAAAGIADAVTIGEAYRAQKTGILAIKEIQKNTLNENRQNIATLREKLSRLPDDKALINQSVAGLVDSCIVSYNGLSDYQKTRLSTVEIEKCEMLIAAKEDGLPDAVAYNLSYEIKADTDEAETAIEDMIQYLQDHNTIKWWGQDQDTMSEDLGSAANQAKDDADKLLQFNANIGTQNAKTAEPVVRIALPIDVGQYAYLLVREDSGHCITGTSGAAWTISDENFKFSAPDDADLGYTVERNMTVKVNGTEYELKSIEYEGIEGGDVNFKDAPSFIDRSTYKGKDDLTYVNVTFNHSLMYFTMPYEDVKITFHWGTVDSADDITDAKTAAVSDLLNTYDGFDLSRYDEVGKTALLAAKTNGEAAIDEATTLEGVAKARKAALAAMLAVSVKSDGQTNPPEGVVLPGYGDVVGKVKVSVRNDTYKGGDFTGKIIDGWYDLCEGDTMMTAVLKALATAGYTWKGEGGTGVTYDYDITYLASIEKGTKKLSEFSGEAGSGWMGTLNDWFVNEGLNTFGVKNGKLESGDIVEIQYTQNLGVDLGGTWNNSDTSLKSISVNGGTLAPSFSSSIQEYTLLIPEDQTSVTLTPTASNKNYLVKTFLNNYNRDSSFYKRTESISVKDGDMIYVGVGDKSWPSMNKQGTEARDYTGTKYIITVKQSGVESVMALITDLPDEKRITFSSYTKYEGEIKAVRAAYDALPDKSEVTNLAKLTAAEAKVAYYTEIEHVKTLMSAIPSASKITLAHKDAVMAADAAYKKLTDEQKKYITIGDVANYNAAIDKLTELGAFKGNEKPSKVGGSTAAEVPKEVVSVELKPEATITGNEGKATISKADANKAVEDLKKEDGNELLIQPKLDKAVDKLTVEVPKSALKEVANGTKAVVTVKSSVAEITLSQEALKTIAKEAGNNVSITAEKVDNAKLSEENKALVGGNPVFNLSIGVDNKAVTNFNGKVTISLPYTPKKDENVKKLTVYYLDDSGKATEMPGAYYDEKTGAIVFDTDHFSTFAIVYDKNRMTFEDVRDGAWYYDAVCFVADNKLFNGTSDTKFAPDTEMTRAMLVTVLYRMNQAAIEAADSAVTTSGSAVTGSAVATGAEAKNFADVKADSWYTDAVIWANANGIISGYGSGLFGTNDSITREQLATILYHCAAHRGYDVTKTMDLKSYADSSKIHSWAETAMKWAVSNQLVTGTSAETLSPSAGATRAQVAMVLMRFCETIEK